MSNFIDDKEYEEALQEAEAVAGEELYCQTVKFRQAREWEGQTYDSLTFDWGKLTGEDFLAIEQQMLLRGKAVISPEFSSQFLTLLAVKACREQVDEKFFRRLPIAVFNRIRNGARSFLLAAQA